MLATVDFCGLNITRLIIGANPFAGFSHQTPGRDREMREYHSIERIIETWRIAEKAGINAMITNNTTPHVLQAVRKYLDEDGALRWIAQVAARDGADMFKEIDKTVEAGAAAIYFHGEHIDNAFAVQDDETLRAWFSHAESAGIPAGAAAHSPQAHLWINSLDITDFHAVSMFNCGSLHSGKGHKFRLADMSPAIECIGRIQKPCIAYKILGAGRIDPVMGFEYALERIKPTDVVNVGMHRGDKDNMVQENVAIVENILRNL